MGDAWTIWPTLKCHSGFAGASVEDYKILGVVSECDQPVAVDITPPQPRSVPI